MLNKYKTILLGLIILLAFVLRFYSASVLLLDSDEEIDFVSAKSISLNFNNLKLPLIEKMSQDGGLMFHKYLIRLGWYIFGESNLGARIPFIIIGILTILVVYFLVKFALGTNIALLASLLLSIDQCHIGISRGAQYDTPHLFFVVLSLLFFYKAITTSNKNLLLVNGLIIGIGFWVRESILFLIPIYLIFLWVCPEYRTWFKKKHLWISFGIAFLVMLPLIYFSLNPNLPRFNYFRTQARIGVISLNATALYLGELILLMIKPFTNFFDYVVDSIEPTTPTENFVFGILILISVIKTIRNKNPFLRLLLTCFIFNFAIFTFVRHDGRANRIWAMESPNWSILGFIPGVILAANMIGDLIRKHVYAGSLFFAALVIFLFIRAWDLVTYPLNGYFPAKDYCIKSILWNYSCSMKRRMVNTDLAKYTIKKVYEVTENQPLYKKIAALRLAQLLMQEGKYKESERYLNYLRSQEPEKFDTLDLNNPLELLDELRWQPHFDNQYPECMGDK
jgi:hypothetical protein